jgi:hypothetical protein
MTFGEFRFLSFSPRMRLVRVPRRSSSSDVDNLDAALWAEAKMDADIRKRIRELIFFNSKMVFQFLGFNPSGSDWSVLEKTSLVSIPERTHVKVDLKSLPKNDGDGNKKNGKSKTNTEALESVPPGIRLLKRKLNPAQYLAGKRKKKAEEEAAAAAAEAVTKGKAGNNGENQRETTEDAEERQAIINVGGWREE